MPQTTFRDSQLGDILVRRHQWAKGVSVRLSVKGEIVATAPRTTPLLFIKQVIKQQRASILELQESNQQSRHYSHGQLIGHSHRLEILPDPKLSVPSIHVHGQTIRCFTPPETENSRQTQQSIRDAVIKALRKESKAYLTRRLKILAQRHGYTYDNLRFTHASTRWGSCSSNGTISLNIALMTLPLDLIDYVLIHELCHTKEMNHSSEFWQLVAAACPDHKRLKAAVKTHSPNV